MGDRFEICGGVKVNRFEICGGVHFWNLYFGSFEICCPQKPPTNLKSVGKILTILGVTNLKSVGGWTLQK